MATMPASKRAAVCAGSGSVECACEGGEKNVTRNMDACCQGLAKRGGKRVYKVYLPVGSWRKAGQVRKLYESKLEKVAAQPVSGLIRQLKIRSVSDAKKENNVEVKSLSDNKPHRKLNTPKLITKS